MTAAQSRQRQAILKKLLFEQVGGKPLVLSDLAASLGVDYTTLRYHLKVLAKEGALQFASQGPGRPPLVRLLVRRGIPVVGTIVAGGLDEALEDPQGFLNIPGFNNHFAVFVRGDSMADYLQDSDLVILRREPPARSGLICAVRVDNDSATLKYLEWKGSQPKRYVLRPHNPSYPTLKVAAERVFIDGVFDSALRGSVIRQLISE